MNCVLFVRSRVSLENIGEMWNLTRERTRQIEERALIKFYKTLISFRCGPAFFSTKEYELIKNLPLDARMKNIHPRGGAPLGIN